jgi:endonuclease/exonuclease/phosphatase family metal-dependent hydrolase
MVRLASEDRPDVLCLQEVPAWALPKLGEWAAMHAFTEIAARPKLGPLPSSAKVGRRLTALNPGLLRSAFAGQGNAILLDPAFEPMDDHAIVLNPRGFRREQAARSGLGRVARLAWAKERRVCQTVRAGLPDGRRILVANLHATSYPPDRRIADAELTRAAELVLALASPGEIDVVAGDFNVFPSQSVAVRMLVEQGFSQPAPEVDHILVRGAASSPPERWPEERRRLDGMLLSDHPPLEVRIE